MPRQASVECVSVCVCNFALTHTGEVTGMLSSNRVGVGAVSSYGWLG